MVVTRSGGAKKNDNLVKQRYSRKKELFVSPQHLKHSPLSAPQLMRSEAGHLFPDLLKHRGQNTVTFSRKGRVTRMARRVTVIGKFYKPKVEDTEGLISATKSMENAGRNLSSIKRTLQLLDGNLSGSIVQPDIRLSAMQHPEAVDLSRHCAFAADLEGTPQQVTTMADENMSLSDGNRTINNIKNNPVDTTTAQREDDVALSNTNNGSCGFLRNSNQPTTSLNLTEIAEQMSADDASEVDSLGCNSCLITVRGYKVKPQYMDPLGRILSKHGDIAVNCDRPVAIRSFYVEYLCEALEKLKTTTFVTITRNELEDIMASLNHIEGERVEVGWLKKSVNVILEAKHAISLLRPTSDLKQRLVQKKSRIQSLKEQLEIYKKDYAIKQADIANLEDAINMSNCQLFVEIEEATEAENMISDYKTKLKYVFGSSH